MLFVYLFEYSPDIIML